MPGIAEEACRAGVHAWQRIRTFAQLALTAAVVGAPFATTLHGSWPGRAAGDDPVAVPYRINTPAPSPPPELALGANPLPRGAPALPAPAAPASSGGRVVWASWYGPGLYGNRTACGQTFMQTTWGVAHPSLPCGTVVSITYGGRTVTAPVLDRGPYVAGREIDLAEAVARSLDFGGVGQVILAIP